MSSPCIPDSQPCSLRPSPLLSPEDIAPAATEQRRQWRSDPAPGLRAAFRAAFFSGFHEPSRFRRGIARRRRLRAPPAPTILMPGRCSGLPANGRRAARKPPSTLTASPPWPRTTPGNHLFSTVDTGASRTRAARDANSREDASQFSAGFNPTNIAFHFDGVAQLRAHSTVKREPRRLASAGRESNPLRHAFPKRYR